MAAGYGHRRAGDCADIELIAPPARDAAAVTAAAARLTPRGRTPMAEAIRQAAAAIGDSGGSVILVSDGIETCHPDPCAVAQELARNGTRLVVHTVGFALGDPAALAQLRCMAEATGGRALTATELAGEPITAKLTTAPGNGAALGGLKVSTENAWFAARPSGTEDVYKIYAESFKGAEHLAEVQEAAREVVNKVIA